LGELTDLIFSLLGKSGRYFNINGRKVCFLIWTFCVLYWAARNYLLGLKVQTVSCLISAAIHIYGYYTWKKKDDNKSNK
jgi:nicotinamide riboside transporter PnuC